LHWGFKSGILPIVLMKNLFGVAVCLNLAMISPCLADNAIERASDLELRGKFTEAAWELGTALSKDLGERQRNELQFELDRLQRIKKDFPYSKPQLFVELKGAVKDLSLEEFDQWVKEGRFDSREIDGHVMYMSSSVSNLYFRYPELNSRRIPAKNTADLEKFIWETCTAIKKASRTERKPYVLPKQFDVTMTVTAKATAAGPGQTIRAWLPVPRWYPFQTDFELVSTSGRVLHLDKPESPIRAIAMEQRARKEEPTEFKIEYKYTTHGVSFDIDPAEVRPIDASDPMLKPFLREAPHVVFTPELRELSRKIAGAEKNPAIKAKLFYDWIAEQIKYSYAIEYSTIRNISDYCRSKGYGDCGQEALLFISLCRLNGIPARWQSGWNTVPGGKTIHDWSEIYVAPYGWMPVDPYMGIFATRYANTLSPEQKRDVRDFYFGGLDQYRMAANSDHNQALNPGKRSMRSDDVDFQRGELESGDRNIYFDQYSWDLKWREIKQAATP